MMKIIKHKTLTTLIILSSQDKISLDKYQVLEECFQKECQTKGSRAQQETTRRTAINLHRDLYQPFLQIECVLYLMGNVYDTLQS